MWCDCFVKENEAKMESPSPILEVKGVTKSFGAVDVLQGIDFSVEAGSVTALVGDNGAGKSTLIKGLAGIQPFDSGTIFFDGKEVELGDPRAASQLGIEVVYQDLALCDNLDIVQNMFLGRELKRGMALDEGDMESRAGETLQSLSVRTVSSLRQKVSSLSGGQRQTLAIARAIYFGAKILILDEPTSALGQKQQMEVLKTIKKVQNYGNIAIILITHNEIHARLIADRFTFLSLGEVIGSGLSSELGSEEVKRLMAGGAKIGDLAKELEL